MKIKHNPLTYISALLCFSSALLIHSAAAQEKSVYFHRIVSNDGVISAVPVTGPASAAVNISSGLSSSFAGGLASAGQGAIYYSDFAGNKIFLLSKDGTQTEIVSSTAGLLNPEAISYDASHKYLYINDRGHQRIARANLNGSVPVTTVEEVVNLPSLETAYITDMKYNPADGLLYWTDAGLLFRIDVNNITLPASAAEMINTAQSLAVLYFDFDTDTPQNIYLDDISQATKGIHKSPVPALGNSNLSDVSILDFSSDPNYIVYGIAVDKTGSTICFSGFTGLTQELNCADRSNISAYTEIFNNQIVSALSSLLIEESPSARVVTPTTKPAPPAVAVTLTGKKPQAQIILQEFKSALLKNSAVLKALAHAKKTSAKVSFQYSIELSRPTDASGKPLKKKDQDIRKITSKRNQLTVKNLKTNSDYDVRYRVEILSKSPGQDAKVVKKTPYSATTGFLVP